MKRRTFKTGHSLAVTVPGQIVRSWNLQPGEEVDIKVDNRRQRLVYYFPKPRQISLLSWKKK